MIIGWEQTRPRGITSDLYLNGISFFQTIPFPACPQQKGTIGWGIGNWLPVLSHLESCLAYLWHPDVHYAVDEVPRGPKDSKGQHPDDHSNRNHAASPAQAHHLPSLGLPLLLKVILRSKVKSDNSQSLPLSAQIAISYMKAVGRAAMQLSNGNNIVIYTIEGGGSKHGGSESRLEADFRRWHGSTKKSLPRY